MRERHDGIAQFRAKLLALLPLSSGTGIALLLKSGSLERRQLIVVGLFGAAVTVGLLIYELRGIRHCKVLIDRGADIEASLGISEGMWWRRQQEGGRFVTTTTASRIVYGTVILGWLYVAGYGVYSWVV